MHTLNTYAHAYVRACMHACMHAYSHTYIIHTETHCICTGNGDAEPGSSDDDCWQSSSSRVSQSTCREPASATANQSAAAAGYVDPAPAYACPARATGAAGGRILHRMWGSRPSRPGLLHQLRQAEALAAWTDVMVVILKIFSAEPVRRQSLIDLEARWGVSKEGSVWTATFALTFEPV